ncbi:hypothetical protein ACFC18_50190 [Streptomyces sp. NPDC056121]|uniref:hypothetical protein n=1 Tax=Streptomyces sp. NPDC056121 TaxID=3345718 RepID=UPI0035DBA20D
MLFGATFIDATFIRVSTIALSIGTHLQVPCIGALLTVGYGARQVLGPLLAAPLLSHGCHQALLPCGAMVVVAAVASAGFCLRFPGPSRARDLGWPEVRTLREELARAGCWPVSEWTFRSLQRWWAESSRVPSGAQKEARGEVSCGGGGQEAASHRSGPNTS